MGSLVKFQFGTPIDVPKIKYSDEAPKPSRSAEYENSLLKHLFHNEVVWSHGKPRVCVKYPDGHEIGTHVDYDHVEMLPAGTRLFVPADPNEDYDIVTSLTLMSGSVEWTTATAIRDGHPLKPSYGHLVTMDVDGWLQKFTLSSHELESGKWVEVSDMYMTDGEGVSFPSSLRDQEGRLMKRPRCSAHVFGSGSLNLHVYGIEEVGFADLCRLMDGLNTGWTFFSKRMGYFGLRAPWKPKMHKDRRYRDRVPPFNWSLRELYAQHQNPVGFMQGPHLTGWEYTMERAGYWRDVEVNAKFTPYKYTGETLAERMGKRGWYDREPEDPMRTKVRAMMLEEANRIRTKIGG